MATQILAYVVIIGITAILEIAMLHIAEDCIESDTTICKILEFIFGLLDIIAIIITMLLTIKCLSLCLSIIS